MRASTRFSDAIHILCFLKVYEEARITSDPIIEYRDFTGHGTAVNGEPTAGWLSPNYPRDGTATVG